jgi:hypothetical protein
MPEPRQPDDVDRLILAICTKLRENRAMVNRSIKFGRVTWRSAPRGNGLEVELDIKI